MSRLPTQSQDIGDRPARDKAYMYNHHRVWAQSHKIKHLAVVLQLADSCIDDCGLVAPQLGILTGVGRQSVAVLLG